MRGAVINIFLIIASLFGIVAHADESFIKKVDGNRIYINAECLHLIDGKIYLDVSDATVPLPTLRFDKHGPYLWLEDAIAPKEMWTCPRCVFLNYANELNCWRCGRDKPQKGEF